MTEENQGTDLFEMAAQSELQVYRASLASLEAERARLIAKYDDRIEAAKNRIAELEGQRAGVVLKSGPSRKRSRSNRSQKAPST